MRLREADFENNPEIVSDSEASWPYKYDNIEPYYTKAEKILAIAGATGEDPTEPFRTDSYPCKLNTLSETSQMIKGAAEKLNLKPFSVGFIPLSSFDTKEGKLYLEIKIDREESLRELKSFYGKSLAFAIEIGYFSEGTIKFMIAKAGTHEISLENLTEEKKKPDTEGVKESKDNHKTPDSLSDNTKNKRDKPLVSADSEITESEQSKKSEPSGEANTQQDKSKEENK